MSDKTVELNVKGLEQLLKALKAKPPKARVGILGATPRANAPSEITHAQLTAKRTIKQGAKKQATTSNAEVGAAHEFGTEHLPQRSFLRVPIADRLTKEIESSGALDKDVLANVVKQGSVKPWLEKIVVLAEGIVAGAFASAGYGKWPSWKTGYSSKTGNILVDTQQLRNSITGEVK